MKITVLNIEQSKNIFTDLMLGKTIENICWEYGVSELDIYKIATNFIFQKNNIRLMSLKVSLKMGEPNKETNGLDQANENYKFQLTLTSGKSIGERYEL